MARMVATVATAILLLLQVIAWQGIFGNQARQAAAVMEQAGPGVVVFDPSSHIRPEGADELLRQLPDRVAVFMLGADRDRDGNAYVQFTGTCDDLRVVGVACPSGTASERPTTIDPRVSIALEWTFGPTATVDIVPGPARGDDLTRGGDPILLLVDRSGTAIDIPALKRLSYTATGHVAQVHVPGAGWLAAGIPNLEQARWSGLYGAIAIAALLIAAGVSATAEHHRRGRAIAPLSVLTDDHRVNRVTAIWLVGVPITAAGFAATLLGAWIAQPVNTIGAGLIGPVPVTSCLAATGIIAAAMTVWAVRLGDLHSRQWTPGGA